MTPNFEHYDQIQNLSVGSYVRAKEALNFGELSGNITADKDAIFRITDVSNDGGRSALLDQGNAIHQVFLESILFPYLEIVE